MQASGKIKKLRVSSQTSAKKPAKEKAVENNKGEEKEKLVTVPKPISKEKEKDVVDDFFEVAVELNVKQYFVYMCVIYYFYFIHPYSYLFPSDFFSRQCICCNSTLIFIHVL